MRNRIKQLLKKEDGFTLVELLGVIVILGIILAIAIPSIGGIVDGAREKTREAQLELVYDAANMYFIENNEEGSVTLDKLVELNYLEEADFAKYEFTKDEIPATGIGNPSKITNSIP